MFTGSANMPENVTFWKLGNGSPFWKRGKFLSTIHKFCPNNRSGMAGQLDGCGLT